MSADPNREAFLQIVEKRSPLDGRFSDIKRIDPTGGNGNFSLIFTANDSVTGQRVALKFYHPNQRHDPYRWACFKREIEVLESLLGQKDIIAFHSGQSEFVEAIPWLGASIQVPFAYYGMELASTDMGIVSAMGIWTAERLLVAFREMCRAVQRIHIKGIAHRDLKPRNFLVSRDGKIRLSDFGTARNIRDHEARILPSYSGPPGDLRYAAPELLACLHDDDPRFALAADIFALGAVLFELFTGVVLVPLVFDASAINDLAFLMGQTKKGDRSRVYHGFVSSMANAHPLPDISTAGSVIPPCIVERLNRLYKALAAVDYRARLTDFERVFWQIDSTLLVLRHESSFQKWRNERRRRREIGLAKARRAGVDYDR